MASLLQTFTSLILLLLLENVKCAGGDYNDMCSIYCDSEKCTSLLSNQCEPNHCRNPWVWNASTLNIYGGLGACVLGDTNYKVISVSDDTQSYDLPDGSLVTGNAISGTSPCEDGPSREYYYHGNFYQADSIVFTDSVGVDVPHYELRVMFWAILIDDWRNDDKIHVDVNAGQATLEQRRDSNRVTRSKICEGGNQEDLIIFDRSFDHNISEPITLTISTSGSNDQWGVKQVILLAKLCHPYCTSCYTSSYTDCWSCEQDTPYYLSGNTCWHECLNGYGNTVAGDVCVKCNLQCQECFELAHNCSECKVSGTYQSYLLDYNFSCEYTCPVGMWGNDTDHVCYFCEVFCIDCQYAPDYCYQCDKTLGYAWKDHTCYSPCPIGTFLDNNATNCTDCSPFCISCENTTINCTACVLTGYYQSYLLGTDCLRVCPEQYYQFTNNGTQNTCQPCDPSCRICTSNPTPCQACNPDNFLFEEGCVTECPLQQYFEDYVTWECLLCEDHCVKLTIDMKFSSSVKEQIIVDMIFTEDLDFSTFPMEDFQTFEIDSDFYSLDMFNFKYQILTNNSYRITLEPKGYIFLYNATFTVTTMELPGTVHEASNRRPFSEQNYQVSKELVWFLINSPDMSETERSIINGLSGVCDTITNYTSMPYVQELKKMGIFTLFFGGAQITSTLVLVNNIPSQNLYEGVRFWAQFVFFDVPSWEANSNKTKFFVVPTVENLIKNARLLQSRTLFNTNDIEWRFQRTGHTSFFIFDSYAIIFLICVCWVLLLIGYCLNKHKPLLFKKHMGKFYTLLHKVHEISILYIMLATIMQWIYFDGNSVERWVSFSLCMLFNIYFLIYELYIYYDMIKYPVANIGTQKYQYYAIRYGSLLKNIRYEEYDLKQPWSPKHWFRPYNYHILSYYKKLMMIVSLPLFYETTHAQAIVLCILQLAQIIRFCVIWPFYRQWRNIVRFVLECALLMFFITIFVQGFLVQQIMKNDQATLQQSIIIFYRFGWVGFTMCFFFNIGFIILYLFDLVRGCKMTNREMMDEARRVYYYRKLKQYEQENEDVPLGLVNKWVKLGNLNKRDYDQLPDINIRVEYFRIVKTPNSNSYEIEMKKLLELFMNIEYNFSQENNVNVGRKLNKKFTLNRQLSSQFYIIIDNLYQKYYQHGVESVILKTFQKVQQSLYKPGQRIELNPQIMTQKIEIINHSGEKKIDNLGKMIEGFPIPEQDLKFIL